MRDKGTFTITFDEQTLPVIEQISEGLPGGFFIYHADGDQELIHINGAMLRIFGCDTLEEFKELTGYTFKGIVHPADIDKVEESICTQIGRGGDNLDYVEYRIVRKDGTVRWVEDYGHFVQTQAYGDLFYVFIEDATERIQKRVAELERVNEALYGAHLREDYFKKALLYDAVSFVEINLTRDEFISASVLNEEGEVQNLFAFMGMQPFEKYSDFTAFWADFTETGELDEDVFKRLKEMCGLKKCVAVGEIGLDYYWDRPEREVQKVWFARQLNLAAECRLPVIIHSRDAAKDTVDIMEGERAKEIGGVVHCFSYTKETAKIFLNMGFYIGIGGVLTFKNAKKLKEAVEYIPLDRLVLETDSPYLAPVPNRGQRNSSLNLPYVAAALAQLKGVSEERLRQAVWENSLRLYRMA